MARTDVERLIRGFLASAGVPGAVVQLVGPDGPLRISNTAA